MVAVTGGLSAAGRYGAAPSDPAGDTLAGWKNAAKAEHQLALVWCGDLSDLSATLPL